MQRRLYAAVHVAIGMLLFVASAYAAAYATIDVLHPVAYAFLYAAIEIGLGVSLLLLYARFALGVRPAALRIPRFSVAPRWVLFALAMPLALTAFYLLFVPGQVVRSDFGGAFARGLIAYGILCAALAAGLCEELYFRGLILSLLEDAFGPRAALLVNAALFALLHVGAVRGGSAADFWQMFIAITLIGCVLSAIAQRTGSVWPAAMLHAAWNLIIIGGFISVGSSGNALLRQAMESQSRLLTGGLFGVEASLPAMALYVLALAAVYRMTPGHRERLRLPA